MTKHWLIISCGDVLGISYELALKTVLIIRKNNYNFEPILVGNSSFLDYVAKKCKIALKPFRITSSIIKQIKYLALPKDKYLVVDVLPNIKQHNEIYKKAAYIVGNTIKETCNLIKNFTDYSTNVALLTMPVAKKNVVKFLPKFVGHTEYLQKEFSVKPQNISMLMEGEGEYRNIYRVLMLTRHIPLKRVTKDLKIKSIVSQVENVVKFINRYEDNKVNKIYICNINPHCGENGLLGLEEKQIINRSISILKNRLKIKSIKLMFSADAFINVDNTTLIVCNYHDQAMLPLKILCGYRIVNITVGLPFFRVSPGHGTAEDIALKNIVDTSGVELCLKKLKEFLKNVKG